MNITVESAETSLSPHPPSLPPQQTRLTWLRTSLCCKIPPLIIQDPLLSSPLVYSSDDRNPAGIFPFLPSILSLSCSPPSWVSPLSIPNLHFPSVSLSLVPLCCSLFLILLFCSTSFLSLPFSSSVVPTPL